MPKGLPWFRLYSEFAFDPKMQTISETLQRRYIMLLCLKCHGDLPGLNDIQLSGALRISVDELHETHKSLLSIGVIDENYDIPKWSERQYLSDYSSLRVKKFRDKKSETLQKRKCNGNVTKMKRPISVSVSVSKSVSESFLKFYSAYPKKVAKVEAEKSFNKINPDNELLDKIISAVNKQSQTDQWKKDGGKYIPMPSTWLNQHRWEDEVESFGKSKPDCRTVSTDFSSDEKIINERREKAKIKKLMENATNGTIVQDATNVR